LTKEIFRKQNDIHTEDRERERGIISGVLYAMRKCYVKEVGGLRIQYKGAAKK